MPVKLLQVQTGAWFEVGDHCARKGEQFATDLLHNTDHPPRPARPSPEHWEEAKRHQNRSPAKEAKELKTG
jgi:hypothetical protein